MRDLRTLFGNQMRIARCFADGLLHGPSSMRRVELVDGISITNIIAIVQVLF